MTICKCLSEPLRDDGFAKDGYSALCPTHKHQEGNNDNYVKLEYKDEYPDKLTS